MEKSSTGLEKLEYFNIPCSAIPECGISREFPFSSFQQNSTPSFPGILLLDQRIFHIFKIKIHFLPWFFQVRFPPFLSPLNRDIPSTAGFPGKTPARGFSRREFQSRVWTHPPSSPFSHLFHALLLFPNPAFFFFLGWGNSQFESRENKFIQGLRLGRRGENHRIFLLFLIFPSKISFFPLGAALRPQKKNGNYP